MTLDNCIKRYEIWASDDRISPNIREEHKQIVKRLSSYKKLLEQEPCDDCISRSHFDERVRVAGGMAEYEVSDDFKDGVLTVLEMLKTEPSIQPKPKTGHWIRMKAYEKWGCSECSTVFRFTFKEHNYCPNCGAKMEVEE